MLFSMKKQDIMKYIIVSKIPDKFSSPLAGKGGVRGKKEKSFKLKNNYITLFLFISIILFSAPIAAMESPIVTSIKPLHSLVAAVMGDTGTPVLLVEGMQSPHGYQLKPSQMKALQHARIVFYISSNLETFLTQPLKSLPSDIQKIALIKAPEVITLKLRAGGIWEAHDHKNHKKGQDDPHIWLSIANAKAMVKKIAEELEKIYPEHKKFMRKTPILLSTNCLRWITNCAHNSFLSVTNLILCSMMLFSISKKTIT